MTPSFVLLGVSELSHNPLLSKLVDTSMLEQTEENKKSFKIVMFDSQEKRTKNDARGPARVEIYRKIVPGIYSRRDTGAHSSVSVLTQIQTNDLSFAISCYSARSIG